MKNFLRSLIVLVLVFSSFHANATQVLPLTGRQLVQYANVMAYATYLGDENVDVNDPRTGKSLPATRYRFEIRECLKGDCAGAASFVQFGMDPRQAGATGRLFVIGTSRFTVGKDYVICLGAAAEGTGFRSLIGLGQCKFEVQTNAAGQKSLLNEFNNDGLFEGEKPTKGMKAIESPKQGPVSYDAFKNMVQQWTQEKK